MKDKIKEILQKIENVANNKTGSYNGLIETKTEDYRLLLDNINNLQEKYKNSQITLAEEWKKRLELEEKNKHLDNQIAMLKQQNNAITKMGLDYKSRIEKADKWIDKHIETYTKNNISIIDWDTFADPRQLKNILKGLNKDV